MTEQTKPATGKTIAQLLFVAWLLVINLLYYAQFRGLFFARLGVWFRRWH